MGRKVNIDMKEGTLYSTTAFGCCKIIKYIGSTEVYVEFIDTGSVVKCRSGDLRKGEVKDPSVSTVYGKGIVGVGDFKATTNIMGLDIKTDAYISWTAMIRRCYDHKYQKYRPTYIGCTVCEDWLHFQRFARWFYKHYNEGFVLDKDILARNNKQYCPENCRLVPPYINTLISHCGSARGILPIGVTLGKNGVYLSRCKSYSISLHLGTYHSEYEAFYAYKKFKEAHIKVVAKEQYLLGNIDIDIFEALCTWNIVPFPEKYM